MKPERCHATASKEYHCAGCRPARPLCRWMRRRQEQRRPCTCEAQPWPHRAGWCAKHGNVPVVIRESRTYQEELRKYA
jgi:hypothetical protein